MNNAETRTELIDPKLRDCERVVVDGSRILGWHTNTAVNDTVNDAVSDAVNDALIDAVNTILNIKEGDGIKDIMDATGKSNATVKRYLQTLREINFVEFKGATKSGKYFLTKYALNKIAELKK